MKVVVIKDVKMMTSNSRLCHQYVEWENANENMHRQSFRISLYAQKMRHVYCA